MLLLLYKTTFPKSHVWLFCFKRLKIKVIERLDFLSEAKLELWCWFILLGPSDSRQQIKYL